jgi:hypothetical protein
MLCVNSALRSVSALLAAFALTATPALTPTAVAAAPDSAQAQCSTTYLDGDRRLGPDQLPAPGASEVGNEVAGYQRTGQETPEQFLARYYDATANGGQGSFIYPPANGFVVNPDGSTEEIPQTLLIGTRLDRYGSEFGGFLAPYGDPYGARSIPPANLDTFDSQYPCNYHAYQVLQPFAVEAGPVAAWFAEPGGGQQYQLDGALLPGKPTGPNVKYLIDNGYLQRVN